MFLKLEGRQVLVIGAGKVGESKIAGILDTGARIRVIAREATDSVHGWARAGQLELELRSFSAQDLDGAFVAIVATAPARPVGSIEARRPEGSAKQR